MANSVAQSCLDSVLKSQAEIPVTIVTGKRYAIESIRVETDLASRSPPINANQLVFIGRNLNAEVIRTNPA